MLRRPISPNEGIITKQTGIDIGIEGIMFGALALLAFCAGTSLYAIDTGRTMAFCTLSITELFHAWNVKSEKSIFSVPPAGSFKLFAAVTICILLQVSVVFIPMLRGIFSTVPLTPGQWGAVLALSLLPLGVSELEKLAERRRRKRQAAPDSLK